MFDPQLYRDKSEVEEAKKRDPIDRLVSWMRQGGMLHEADLAGIEAAVAKEIDRSIAISESGKWEPVATLTADVYAGEATS